MADFGSFDGIFLATERSQACRTFSAQSSSNIASASSSASLRKRTGKRRTASGIGWQWRLHA
jgi:hypothetical protein